jgi:signal transduction histidine kinase
MNLKLPFKKPYFFYLLILCFLAPKLSSAQDTVFYKTNELLNISRNVVVEKGITKKGNSTSIKEKNSSHDNIRFSDFNASYNIEFTIADYSPNKNLILFSNYINARGFKLFRKDSAGLTEIKRGINSEAQQNFTINDPDFVYQLSFTNAPQTYILQIQKPNPNANIGLKIAPLDLYLNQLSLKNFFIGIYIGILLGTFFYNLFIYFSLKDKSYLFYCLYILFLGLAQLASFGYLNVYFFYKYPFLNKYALNTLTSLAFITGLVFAKRFLHLQTYARKSIYLINALIISYCVVLVSTFFQWTQFSYSLLTCSAIICCVSLIIISSLIIRKGFTPAVYYLVAWIALLSGLLIYVLKSYDIVNQTFFTNNILLIGSALESILLSIALANRINILQKEKDISQKRELAFSQENEKLIREQNVVLEEKVEERTEALQTSNTQLVKTLSDLKDAQLQLVEAEKMASLGQLTAGIAHEINNPINFVKSNIVPLRLDVKDLFFVIDQYGELHQAGADAIKSKLQSIDSFKKEIDIDFVKTEIKNLIKGIEEGAERTAEIVRGLRTFSRLDESELKVVNVHEGIDSTLVLLRNSMPNYVEIIKDYRASGNIECYPGKLNQVFMNILNNSIQAIASKKILNRSEYITISTRDIEMNQIEISIKDTGPGMTEEVKHKIFEPFFTTKAIGEGTGLGMAIVFKIIEQHLGKINIISTVDEGAEFILTLPYSNPVS